MKRYYVLFLFITIISSCGLKDPDKYDNGPVVTIEENYFPVTSYMQGQVANLKAGFANPLVKTTHQNKTDSIWARVDQLDSIYASFITPLIDPKNRINAYKESRFMDQSTNSITFTYEPKADLKDTDTLMHWEVYVNPETEKVSRLHITKKGKGNEVIQLIWNSADGWSREAVYSATNPPELIREVNTHWKFDER